MVADVMAGPVISVQPGTSFKGMIQLPPLHVQDVDAAPTWLAG